MSRSCTSLSLGARMANSTTGLLYCRSLGLLKQSLANRYSMYAVSIATTITVAKCKGTKSMPHAVAIGVSVGRGRTPMQPIELSV
jgi:hypothetical protein